jgi:magnesium-transporting ATPase (P-type)
MRFIFINSPVGSFFDFCFFLSLILMFEKPGNISFPFGFSKEYGDNEIDMRTGWFVFGTLTQIATVLVMRTEKIIFFEKTKPALPLLLSSFLIATFTISLP